MTHFCVRVYVSDHHDYHARAFRVILCVHAIYYVRYVLLFSLHVHDYFVPYQLFYYRVILLLRLILLFFHVLRQVFQRSISFFILQIISLTTCGMCVR